jgi:hypothetical protein
MKKIAVLFCLLIPLLLAACVKIYAVPVSPVTATPAATAISTASPMPSPSASSFLPAATPAAGTPTPYTGPALYTSYAYMVSYNPSTGYADFDYFDLLQGKDAVKWLVSQEGYSQAEAEKVVADFADSEFIEKNTNPQLRTIDLSGLPLKLMYDKNGNMDDYVKSFNATIADLNALYALDSSLVLDSFFYKVHVTDGTVISVEQVYWP